MKTAVLFFVALTIQASCSHSVIAAERASGVNKKLAYGRGGVFTLPNQMVCLWYTPDPQETTPAQ